jgi:hypothetical protein
MGGFEFALIEQLASPGQSFRHAVGRTGLNLKVLLGGGLGFLFRLRAFGWLEFDRGARGLPGTVALSAVCRTSPRSVRSPSVRGRIRDSWPGPFALPARRRLCVHARPTPQPGPGGCRPHGSRSLRPTSPFPAQRRQPLFQTFRSPVPRGSTTNPTEWIGPSRLTCAPIRPPRRFSVPDRSRRPARPPALSLTLPAAIGRSSSEPLSIWVRSNGPIRPVAPCDHSLSAGWRAGNQRFQPPPCAPFSSVRHGRKEKVPLHRGLLPSHFNLASFSPFRGLGGGRPGTLRCLSERKSPQVLGVF